MAKWKRPNSLCVFLFCSSEEVDWQTDCRLPRRGVRSMNAGRERDKHETNSTKKRNVWALFYISTKHTSPATLKTTLNPGLASDWVCDITIDGRRIAFRLSFVCIIWNYSSGNCWIANCDCFFCMKRWTCKRSTLHTSWNITNNVFFLKLILNDMVLSMVPNLIKVKWWS